MFTLRSPAAFNSSAYRASRTPLVVRAMSSMASICASIRMRLERPMRTSGSPPVMRTFLIPSSAAAVAIRWISS